MEELCESLLTGDILYDCDNPPVGGIEVNVLIGNRADIDYGASTVDPTNKTKLTNFALKEGKSAFFIQGVKQIQRAQSELVVKETGPNKHKHLFAGVVLSPSAANKLQAQYLSEGANLFVIVETKWKGTAQADAFQLLGFRSGLEASVMTWNTTENDGAIMFEVSSPDGFEEPTLPMTLLETSYAATKTLFDNKFEEEA
jgi:hypothetical protein